MLLPGMSHGSNTGAFYLMAVFSDSYGQLEASEYCNANHSNQCLFGPIRFCAQVQALHEAQGPSMDPNIQMQRQVSMNPRLLLAVSLQGTHTHWFEQPAKQ